MVEELLSGALKENLYAQTTAEVLASPEIFRTRLRSLLSEVLADPPTSVDMLQTQIRWLEELDDILGETVSTQMSFTHATTRGVTDLEEKTGIWTTQWETVIRPTLDDGVDTATQIVEALKANMRTAGYDLSDVARNQYDELLNAELARIKSVAEARTELNDFTTAKIRQRDMELIPSIKRRGGKANFDNIELRNWFAEFEGGRADIWREAETRIARAAGDVTDAASVVDAFPMPMPVAVTDRPLVMVDVGNLYAARPDAVTNGMFLPDLMAMRPKIGWVESVYGRVRRVGRQTGASP